MNGSIHWWIGDWLNYGEDKWNERCAQLVDQTNFEYETIRVDSWVAKKIDFVLRRTELSWSHHKEVASLSPQEQDRWLRLAEKKKWSKRDLRKQIKNDKEKNDLPQWSEDSDCDFPDSIKLYCGDFADVAQELPPRSFSLIITDPPYSKEYIHLYELLAKEAKRLLRPGGSLLAMAGQSYIPLILDLMTPHLHYHWMISYDTPGGQSPQLWTKKVNSFWKPVLWFVKGEYDGKWHGDKIKSNVNDNDKRFHKWGQSESGIGKLVSEFAIGKDANVLDPFVGGGTTAVVCYRLKIPFTGVDIKQEEIDITKRRILKEIINDG